MSKYKFWCGFQWASLWRSDVSFDAQCRLSGKRFRALLIYIVKGMWNVFCVLWSSMKHRACSHGIWMIEFLIQRWSVHMASERRLSSSFQRWSSPSVIWMHRLPLSQEINTGDAPTKWNDLCSGWPQLFKKYAMQRLCLWYGWHLQCLVDIINHMLKECNKEPDQLPININLELWFIYFVNMPNDYSLSLIDKILCCHRACSQTIWKLQPFCNLNAWFKCFVNTTPFQIRCVIPEKPFELLNCTSIHKHEHQYLYKFKEAFIINGKKNYIGRRLGKFIYNRPAGILRILIYLYV